MTKGIVISGKTYFGINEQYNNIKIKVDDNQYNAILKYLKENDIDITQMDYIPINSEYKEITIKISSLTLYYDCEGNPITKPPFIRSRSDLKVIINPGKVWERTDEQGNVKKGFSFYLSQCKTCAVNMSKDLE